MTSSSSRYSKSYRRKKLRRCVSISQCLLYPHEVVNISSHFLTDPNFPEAVRDAKQVSTCGQPTIQCDSFIRVLNSFS